MSGMRLAKWLALGLCMNLMLDGCYHPPYNNFKPYNRTPRDAAIGAGVGAIEGAVVGSTLFATGIGAGAGALVFVGNGVMKESKSSLIRYLEAKGDIRFEQYGDTMMLIVPTDRYYYFNSTRLMEICYPSLVRMVKLIKYYPNRTIYVAGFTDSMGSRRHKKMLSQGQAEAMVTFLWANNIPAKLLNAEGYGDKHPVSNNKLIHGAAHNRHLEIQWYNSPICCRIDAAPVLPPTK